MATEARKRRNAIAQAEREERQRAEIAVVRRQKEEAKAERQRQREAQVAAVAAAEAARQKAASRRRSFQGALVAGSVIAVIAGFFWMVTRSDSISPTTSSESSPAARPELTRSPTSAETAAKSSDAAFSDELPPLRHWDTQGALWTAFKSDVAGYPTPGIESTDDEVGTAQTLCMWRDMGITDETAVQWLEEDPFDPWSSTTGAAWVAAADRHLC